MSHLNKVLLLFPLLLLCTSSSPAQTVKVGTHRTATKLQDLCREHAGECLGYIQGAADGFAFAMAHGWVPTSWKACTPKGVTGNGLVRVFLEFIDNHPEQLSYSAADVVWNAMAAAYPCPAK
jgi:hypothetical protein